MGGFYMRDDDDHGPAEQFPPDDLVTFSVVPSYVAIVAAVAVAAVIMLFIR